MKVLTTLALIATGLTLSSCACKDGKCGHGKKDASCCSAGTVKTKGGSCCSATPAKAKSGTSRSN